MGKKKTDTDISDTEIIDLNICYSWYILIVTVKSQPGRLC